MHKPFTLLILDAHVAPFLLRHMLLKACVDAYRSLSILNKICKGINAHLLDGASRLRQGRPSP